MGGEREGGKDARATNMTARVVDIAETKCRDLNLTDIAPHSLLLYLSCNQCLLHGLSHSKFYATRHFGDRTYLRSYLPSFIGILN